MQPLEDFFAIKSILFSARKSAFPKETKLFELVWRTSKLCLPTRTLQKLSLKDHPLKLPWNVVYIWSSVLGFVCVPDQALTISFNIWRKKEMCTYIYALSCISLGLFGFWALKQDINSFSCQKYFMLVLYFFSYTTDLASYKLSTILSWTWFGTQLKDNFQSDTNLLYLIQY